MKQIQDTVSLQPLTGQSSANITYTLNKNMGIEMEAKGFIVNKNTVLTSAYNEHMLVTVGKGLAEALAKILDQLSQYDKDATDPIISILEPYIEKSQDLYVHMPPKSSREVTIEVTVRGKAKPKASLD